MRNMNERKFRCDIVPPNTDFRIPFHRESIPHFSNQYFIRTKHKLNFTMTLGRNDSAPILTSLSNHRKGQKWTMNGRWRDSVGSRRSPNPGPGSYSGVAPSSYKYASSAAFGFGSGSRAVFTKDGNPGLSRKKQFS